MWSSGTADKRAQDIEQERFRQSAQKALCKGSVFRLKTKGLQPSVYPPEFLISIVIVRNVEMPRSLLLEVSTLPWLGREWLAMI
jgi:hypothetical protein